MNALDRRSLLVADANPNVRLDYLAVLEGRLSAPAPGGPVAVSLRYVPDKLVLGPTAFARYLDALGAGPWETLEQLAVTLLDDIANEIIARWTQVILRVPGDAPAGSGGHAVVVEDRQPAWDNPDLLSRLLQS